MIKSSLQKGYYHDVAGCAADIRLVFQNAMNYNPAGHPVHAIARTLLEEFETEYDTILDKLTKDAERKATHSCTLCNGLSCPLCGEKCLKFEPPMLVCHGSCGQKIKRNMVYYVSQDGSKLWCQKCHGSLPHSSEIGRDENGVPQILFRKSLLKRRFDEEVSEPWVQCEDCGEWVHQVCALFNDRYHESATGGQIPSYSCPLCKLGGLKPEHQPAAVVSSESETSASGDEQESPSRRRERESDGDISQPMKRQRSEDGVIQCQQEEPISSCQASTLPETYLGTFIEKQVKYLLHQQGYNDIADTVSVRLVSNIDGHMEVPDIIRDNLKAVDGFRVPQYLPYRSKCILLFQKIDGVDKIGRASCRERVL